MKPCFQGMEISFLVKVNFSEMDVYPFCSVANYNLEEKLLSNFFLCCHQSKAEMKKKASRGSQSTGLKGTKITFQTNRFVCFSGDVVEKGF